MSERCNFYFGGMNGGNRCQGRKDHPEAEGHHWQADRDIAIEGVPRLVCGAVPAPVSALREAAKNVPDPAMANEGFCESCGDRPELVEVQKSGYKAWVYKHKETCWFGALAAALKETE